MVPLTYFSHERVPRIQRCFKLALLLVNPTCFLWLPGFECPKIFQFAMTLAGSTPNETSRCRHVYMLQGWHSNTVVASKLVKKSVGECTGNIKKFCD